MVWQYGEYCGSQPLIGQYGEFCGSHPLVGQDGEVLRIAAHGRTRW